MRENLPTKEAGDPLSAQHINDLNRIADSVASGQHGSYGHMRGPVFCPDPGWVQNTVEITQIYDRNAGLFKVKIRYYDHNATGTSPEWTLYGDYNDQFLDVSDWIDPNDSQNYIERLFELDIGDRITAYWHLQRGMWVPICCPKPDEVEGSDDAGVMEHCCVAVCDSTGDVQIETTDTVVLFDTITPPDANTFFLNPSTGEITLNLPGTRWYNISFCVANAEAGSPELITAKLQKDGVTNTWVDVDCPLILFAPHSIVGQGTSPVIVLELLESEKIRVVASSASGTSTTKANASYLSICLNDCLVRPLTIGSGSGA